MKSRICGVFAVMAMMLAAGVQGAYADPISIRVSSGATSCALIDGGVSASGGCGGGDVAGSGVISWFTTVGDWNVVFGIGQGSSVLGSGNLDLTFGGTSIAGTTSTLTIEFTQTGTAPSFPSYELAAGGTLNSGIAEITYSAYKNGSNVAFDESGSGQIGSTLIFNTPGAFSGSTIGFGGSGDVYSLTQIVTIRGSGSSFASATGDAYVAAPEPNSLVLLGAGLVGLAGAFRRKSRSV